MEKTMKRPFLGQLNRYKGYYALGMTGLVLLLLFRFLPMFGLSIAFMDYNIGKGVLASPWVGFKWYKIIFMNGDFSIALKNTLVISILKILLCFPAPIILSLCINELRAPKFAKTVQTLIYLPHFISWAILSGIMFSLFSTQTGIAHYFGITESVFLNPRSFRVLLILSDMWKTAGWGTIIYLAAMSSIDMFLYEAAKIDGASRFQCALYITIPSILNTIIILLILRLGHLLDAGFNQVYMLYNPGVYDVADILDTYIFRVGLTNGRFSLATAAGLFKSMVGLFLVYMTNKIVKIYDPEAGIF